LTHFLASILKPLTCHGSLTSWKKQIHFLGHGNGLEFDKIRKCPGKQILPVKKST